MIRERPAGKRAALVARFDELPPHGRILTLYPPARDSVLQTDAVVQALRPYMQDVTPTGEATPFIGLLIDLTPGPYNVSESDMTAVLASIAAWGRGWIVPTAVVLAGPAASALQNMLDVTEVNQLRELRVVSTTEAGLMHIREILADYATEE